jgi:hypothetical protein
VRGQENTLNLQMREAIVGEDTIGQIVSHTEFPCVRGQQNTLNLQMRELCLGSTTHPVSCAVALIIFNFQVLCLERTSYFFCVWLGQP